MGNAYRAHSGYGSPCYATAHDRGRRTSAVGWERGRCEELVSTSRREWCNVFFSRARLGFMAMRSGCVVAGRAMAAHSHSHSHRPLHRGPPSVSMPHKKHKLSLLLLLLRCTCTVRVRFPDLHLCSRHLSSALPLCIRNYSSFGRAC